MKTIRLALIQMRCEKGDIEGNLAAIERHITEAVVREVDFICFPEMSITGSVTAGNHPEAFLSLTGPEVARFSAMTRERSIVAIAGIVEANQTEKPYITQIVAWGGELQGYYRKITISPDEEPWYSPGSSIKIFAHPDLNFSLAICYDLTNKTIFSESTSLGARLIFEAAAPGLYGLQETRDWQSGYAWWRDECRTRLGEHARVNKIYIAVATQAGRTIDEDFPGGGYLFTPEGICTSETSGPDDEVLYTTLMI